MSSNKEIILVTGSSGLIGAAVIRHLTKDFRAVGFDRDGDPTPPIEAECVCVDLTSEESVQAGLKRVRYAYGNRIASVIHLAAYYDFSGAPSPRYEAVTVRGTERFLRLLQDFQVEQFIFSSSMLVHTPTEPGKPINEESALSARWPYPESKIETEELIRTQHGDIPVVLLRIAGVYNDRTHSLPLAHQIQRIYERTFISHLFAGDKSHGQTYIHLDDLMEVFEKLIRRRAELPPELPLLVGEPETLSYAELQRLFGHLIHNQGWTTIEIPKSLGKLGSWLQNAVPLGEKPFIKPRMIDFADEHYELDITHARTLLDWEPRHSLRDTLPIMVDVLKANPTSWYRDNDLKLPPGGEIPTAAPEYDQGRNIRQPEIEERHMVKEHKQTDQHSAMTERGVTRHAMSMHDNHHDMTSEQRREMREDHHRKTLWIYYLIVLLGLWLISSPFVHGYTDPGTVPARVMEITEIRNLPDIAIRAVWISWSDILSGTLLVVFGFLSLNSRRIWAIWAGCIVGLWLLFAPLVLWSPIPSAYANDTLIGVLVIALTILIPGMPGMSLIMKHGPEIPPGWSYNPSSWLQRAPIIALAWGSFFIGRYLAAYQFGYIDYVWDPFFDNSTMRILDSDVSLAWPISDAGLGVVAYSLEALMGYMGGTQRWRTMPWMVMFFGILVVPLGTVSIVLVILQPVAVGTWCTLCLITALAMLVMIPLTLDEVIAMLQFLIRSKRQGKSLWRTFWLGDTVEGGMKDERSPHFTAPLSKSGPAMVWGVNIPWNLLLSALIGIWLMAVPDILGSQGDAANSDHLVGALVVTTATIAMAEVARPLRFLNILLGLWFVVAPWLLDGTTVVSQWNNVILGLLLILLSIPRGRIVEKYSGWDRFIV